MSLNLLNGNNEALLLLDWPQLTSNIASLAHFELTRDKLLQAPQALDYDIIEQELNLLEVCIDNFENFNLAFSSKIRFLPDGKDFFALIPEISKAKLFEARELHFIAQITECYLNAFKEFDFLVFRQSYSIEEETKKALKKNFVAPLRDFVDQNGNVSYERHPLLKKLYAEVLSLEHDLRISIQKIGKSDVFSNKLQLDNYDIINDRYVLAIRSDSYNSDLGPIIARSQSGMTLFVEPYEVRDKGNKRIHLLAEIEAVILKLTIEISHFIHKHSPAFVTIAEWCLELDWLNTKATFTHKMGLTKPILNQKFYFEFSNIFHPLIQNPIKNNLVLDSSHRGLIISGPNTGGKTVALKSFTLSMLLVHMGFYVPASSANIHPVKDLFYFSHDHQNLSEGLSSFASESKYYLELLSSLGPLNLIVIDEIFNSTSSEEASALAIAFLEEIHSKNKAKVILSTHHQVLKTFMHSNSDYVSAHVGYDFELNKPTYKLVLGEPGSSLAFKIFDNLSMKFGLKTQISQRAKELLDNKQVTYETLLLELSQKKVELDKLLSHNRTLNTELKNQKSSMEGTLFLEREKIINEYTKKIKNIFSEAEKVFEQVKNEKISSKRALQNEMHSIQSAILKEAPAKKTDIFNPEIYAHMKAISFDDIKVGDTVFSVTIRKNVKVQNINTRKKEIQVNNGSLSVWVSIDTLRYSSGNRPSSPQISINVQRTIRGEIEIDCRGMRLEEFQKTCEQSISEVISGEIPFVTIIHGHGDGILKNWLRSYLKKEHQDLQWENIEGNDGCTKIFN